MNSRKKKIIGAVLVALTAAYDTFDQRRLPTKIVLMIRDSLLTNFLGGMLSNRRCFVEFNSKKSRVRLQRNSLPQGSVVAPLLYNTYTSLQAKRFIYADNLCITCKDIWFDPVEKTLSNALKQLKEYYKINNHRANRSKTLVCAFYL